MKTKYLDKTMPCKVTIKNLEGFYMSSLPNACYDSVDAIKEAVNDRYSSGVRVIITQETGYYETFIMKCNND